MKTVKNYNKYLKSDQWADIKRDYSRHNKTDCCLLCPSDKYLEHHHYKYPKNWKDDTYKNLIYICRSCHKMLHYNIDHGSKDISFDEYMKEAKRLISKRYLKPEKGYYNLADMVKEFTNELY